MNTITDKEELESAGLVSGSTVRANIKGDGTSAFVTLAERVTRLEGCEQEMRQRINAELETFKDQVRSELRKIIPMPPGPHPQE